jgi:putative endonuclease
VIDGRGTGENVKRSALQRAFRRGHFAEYAAAAFLMAKGHRILARRFKTHLGEIDLITKRGRRVAFVEVKQRATIEDCESAVTQQTRRRVHSAANLWLARNAQFQNHDLGFDLIFIVPRRWPVHLRDAL